MNLTRVVKDKELLSQTALLFPTLPLPLHTHSWMHGGWAVSEMGWGTGARVHVLQEVARLSL